METHRATLDSIMRAGKSRITVPTEGAAEPPERQNPSSRRAVPVPLAKFLGAGKGCFENAEEIDAFLRGERDAWRP